MTRSAQDHECYLHYIAKTTFMLLLRSSLFLFLKVPPFHFDPERCVDLEVTGQKKETAAVLGNGFGYVMSAQPLQPGFLYQVSTPRVHHTNREL